MVYDLRHHHFCSSSLYHSLNTVTSLRSMPPRKKSSRSLADNSQAAILASGSMSQARPKPRRVQPLQKSVGRPAFLNSVIPPPVDDIMDTEPMIQVCNFKLYSALVYDILHTYSVHQRRRLKYRSCPQECS